jgi:hypothetical protein
MTTRVVDELEFVEVQEQDRRRRSRATTCIKVRQSGRSKDFSSRLALWWACTLGALEGRRLLGERRGESAH